MSYFRNDQNCSRWGNQGGHRTPPLRAVCWRKPSGHLRDIVVYSTRISVSGCFAYSAIKGSVFGKSRWGLWWFRLLGSFELWLVLCETFEAGIRRGARSGSFRLCQSRRMIETTVETVIHRILNRFTGSMWGIEFNSTWNGWLYEQTGARAAQSLW